MEWTEENIERYSRQVVMKEVGVAGQEALCAARFGLPGGAPWATMADLLERAGMTWRKKEGHWLNTGGRALFLTLRTTEDALHFFLDDQPFACTDEVKTDHPLFADPSLPPCLATWWCAVVLGLPGGAPELTFTATDVRTAGE